MRRRLFCLATISSVLMSLPSRANAHVKWFSHYDIAGVPTDLEMAFNTEFVVLFALSVSLLLFGAAIESLAPGRVLLSGLNRITAPLESNAEVLIRASCGFLLVSLWALGGIILTPELKTSQQWISWLQLAMAAGLLWRRTLVFTAVGFVVLYGIAMYHYGAFHLLDYPIFIGLAAYLTLIGCQKSLFGIRPLDVLRVSVAITLMWASVEKWAYPEWSRPIIEATPGMTLGFSREVFMQAAGVIEFALSFALLLGPLVRRTAAIILFAMFISAVGPFGKIDAIGHAPIVGALAAIIGDKSPGGAIFAFGSRPAWRFVQSGAALLVSYCALLVFFVASYYLLHAELYGPMPIALCTCPAHKPERASFVSTVGPQPLSRSGPLCQVFLASSDWWSKLATPRKKASISLSGGPRSVPQTADSCGMSVVGAADALPPK